MSEKNYAGKNWHTSMYKRSAYGKIVKNGEGFIGEQSAAEMWVNDDDVDSFEISCTSTCNDKWLSSGENKNYGK